MCAATGRHPLPMACSGATANLAPPLMRSPDNSSMQGHERSHWISLENAMTSHRNQSRNRFELVKKQALPCQFRTIEIPTQIPWRGTMPWGVGSNGQWPLTSPVKHPTADGTISGHSTSLSTCVIVNPPGQSPKLFETNLKSHKVLII